MEMTINKVINEIPRDLPYWKYCECMPSTTYWEYKLGADVDRDRFVVFKNRLWFITDYVVPVCDNKILSLKEAANPVNKPSLVAILVKRKQSGHDLDYCYSEQYVPSDPIFASSETIPSDKAIQTKYSEYVEATERWLFGRS